MEPDDIFPNIPLEAQGKGMLFNGATCGMCSFRYTEHEGHIIPCPRCAAADLEQRLVEQKALTENAWRVANDQAKQREDLERRVEAAEARAFKGEYEATWPATDERATIRTLESRLARLELEAQTYAEVAAGFQQEKTLLEEEKAQLQAKAFDWEQHWKDEHTRLAQAEAREAAMRSQLDAQYLAGVEWGVKHLSQREDWPQSWDAGFPGFKRQALIDRGPLSPDAGRAPVDEVEKLREMARVLQNTTPEALRQLVTELFMQGRSAWAYLFTDLATSMDALARRGEEGE